MRVPAWVDSYIVKVKSSADINAQWYYVNTYNGNSFWEPPALLRGNELPSQPTHRWVPVNYLIDGQYQTYYVNPFNGMFTQKSLDRAARMLQALVRNRRLSMHYLSSVDFARGVRFERSAEDNYNNAKKKLSTILNYALVQHLCTQDYALAKTVYEQASKLSDTNPLVLRSFGKLIL